MAEQVQLHDRQEVGRYIEQQGCQHQGQAALDHIVPMGVELVATARAVGLFVLLEHRLAHQQVAFVTGHQVIEGQVGELMGVGRF
ncbi:hypothetical protein D3C84_997070 [compost metagenome]